MFNDSLHHYLDSAPTDPGCYMYKTNSDKILYIGKAKNIRKRVNQYFHNFEKLDPKIQIMLEKAQKLEFIPTTNEIEALILESNLIKKYKPKYNTDLKDDKRYVWIKIDKNEDFPRISLTRDKNDKDIFYGPFPSRTTVTTMLKRLRHLFPYRNCSRVIKYIDGKAISSDPKPCLYYHIGLCDAPCANFTSKEKYKQNINKIKLLLNGKTQSITEELKSEMTLLSNELKFEEAARTRDKIREFNYISQQVIVDYGMDEFDFAKAKEERIEKALKNIVEKIKIADLVVKPGFKIECYDISNIQGKNAVGSMVVFVDGKRKKAFYRKFKITVKDTPDDFTMMAEMVRRRLKRIGGDDASFKNAPDLMIIDGGKGQLSTIYTTMMESNNSIPLISLAKREEEIFKVELDQDNKVKFKMYRLKPKSEELFLIQRIRDEAHRFAITYHRNLRSKSSIITTLDSIGGIGPTSKRKLLQEFGSIEGIRKAKKEDVKKILKNSKAFEELMRNL